MKAAACRRSFPEGKSTAGHNLRWQEVFSVQQNLVKAGDGVGGRVGADVCVVQGRFLTVELNRALEGKEVERSGDGFATFGANFAIQTQVVSALHI